MPSNGNGVSKSAKKVDKDPPEITVTKFSSVLDQDQETDQSTKERQELLKVLSDLAGRLEHELQAVIGFWNRNSLDTEHTGFLTCLDYDGTIYDTTKYCELQAQQTYIFAKLYNCTETYRTEEMLENAQLGGEYLLRHVYRSVDHRCYHSTTREGKPLSIKPNLNVDVYFVMALFELYTATRQANYLAKADAVLKSVLSSIRDPNSLNEQRLGNSESHLRNLANVFRMLLAIAENNKDQLRKLKDDFTWCIKHMLFHIQRNNSVVLETVSHKGEAVQGAQGRQVRPGTVFECGWMVMRYAHIINKKELIKKVQDLFIDKMFNAAWDPNNGGLFAYLDVDGLSPTKLTWNMKLWWPVTEAMIALIVSYKMTGERKYLNNFSRVFDYAMVHFREPGHGEWYGYADVEGRVTHTFKGGPKKGCFHVPRCLWICAKIVREIVHMGGVEK